MTHAAVKDPISAATASLGALPVTPLVHVPDVPAPAPSRAGLLGAQLTPVQIELLKTTMMKGGTDDEVAVFAHVCNRLGLDPFARQIYPIKRKSKDEETEQWVEKYVFQVSIDGFRLVAHRTGLYDGSLEPEFYDAGANARKVWLDKAPPKAARVGVLRKGVREPFYVTALWSEYAQIKRDGNPTKQWRDKPTIMLAKCAEAAALRKAFPQELSGVYTDEEMSHADVSDEPTDREQRPVAETRPRPSDPSTEGRQARATEDGDVELLFGAFNGKRVSQLDLEQLSKLVAGWNDPARRATAEQRLGVGAVHVIAAAYQAKKAASGTPAAGMPPSAYIAALLEREQAGASLSSNDQEELRQYRLDHEDPTHG